MIWGYNSLFSVKHPILLKFRETTQHIFSRHLGDFLLWRERFSNDDKPRTATILAHAMVKSGMKQLVGDLILQLGKHMTRWLVVLFQGGRC